MSRRAVPLGVAAAVLVLVIWFLFLWRPRQDDISEAKERRETAEVEASRLRTTLARLEELKAQEALTRSRLEDLRVAVPDQPNLAQFILDANEAANRAGIAFLSVTPSPPAAAGEGGAAGVSSINLTMSISGGYFQVLDYLNRLADLPRVVVIDNLSLAPDETGRLLSASIQGRMFTTAAPGAAAPTTAVPAAPTTSTTVAGAPPATTTTTGAP